MDQENETPLMSLYELLCSMEVKQQKEQVNWHVVENENGGLRIKLPNAYESKKE